MPLTKEPAPIPGVNLVTDEKGFQHFQCTKCGGHAKFMDGLAYKHIRSRFMGLARMRAQLPWAFAGMMRFAWRHLHCIEDDLMNIKRHD